MEIIGQVAHFCVTQGSMNDYGLDVLLLWRVGHDPK